MGRFFLGKHLYNQIVVPLVVAALVVGVAATVVAMYFLSDLTDRWVEQMAASAATGLESRLDDYSRTMSLIVGLAAGSSEFSAASDASGEQALTSILARLGGAYSFDNVMVLDAEGRVVTADGMFDLGPGDVVFADPSWIGGGATAGPALVTIEGNVTLSVARPLGSDGAYVLCASSVVDDGFLRSIVGTMDDAFALYRADGVRLAYSAPPEGDGAGSAATLAGGLDEQAGIVAAVLEQASSTPQGFGSGTIDTDDGRYTIRADLLTSYENATGAADSYFLVSIISQRVSGEARAGTINLIAMWSFIAVLALVGLGGWVARRVSDPLVALTDGARRVAEGDFSAKIQIKGDNEIGELARSFNQMTDSLRDRSESLTKKVLELATLYEMSRSLGSTLDMTELLESVLDSALRIFTADLGYITMIDPETGEIAVRAYRGMDGSRVDDQAVRHSMSEWVIRESRPLVFNPTSGSGRGQVEVVTGALAALCVPLIASDGTIGAITVGSQDPEMRFDSEDVRLLSTIANHVTIAIGNIELFSSLQEAYLATVRSLAAAVDAKDPYTRGHSEGVAVYANMIAERMGLSHEQCVALEMAAYLHDIGKIGIKEEILLKPGTLSDAEMGQMRHHPLIGASILKPVAFPWPIAPVVRHHHEFWDGNGYPAGLRGEEIPLLARILTVADAFEAIISDRPYRKGRTMSEAVAELHRCAGTQFDAAVVEALVEAIGGREEGGCTDADGLPPDLGTDEVRAIFVALSEGMFASFRKLGGPRLAGNVERELNDRFAAQDVPVAVRDGRVTMRAVAHGSVVDETERLRDALRAVDATMGRMSGHTLVDHFYADSMATLPERMRCLAKRLDFYSG